METLGIAIAAAFAAALIFNRQNSQDQSLPTDLPPLNYDPVALTLDIPDITILSDGISDAPASPLSAFLYAIRRSENSERDVRSGNDYGALYGGGYMGDFSDHPTATGEWMGRPLADKTCRAAGQRVGCKSTAAGAYQINRPTWDEFRAAGVYGPCLDDFTPASQDEAARRILGKTGALSAIERGDINAATALASKRWASLPGSTSGQPQRSVEEFAQFLTDGGLYA